MFVSSLLVTRWTLLRSDMTLAVKWALNSNPSIQSGTGKSHFINIDYDVGREYHRTLCRFVYAGTRLNTSTVTASFLAKREGNSSSWLACEAKQHCNDTSTGKSRERKKERKKGSKNRSFGRIHYGQDSSRLSLPRLAYNHLMNIVIAWYV